MKEQAESGEHQPGANVRGSAAFGGRRRFSVRFSPLTTVIAASVLTIMLLAGLGWQARQSYLDHKGTQKQVFPISRLRGKIVHFDEVLTMSANMAAATGDAQWEKRYRQVEPELDVAIKSLRKLVPATFDSAAAIQTDEANVKLVEMENQVFELVGQGRLDEAQAILSGDDYCEQKALYSDGMERIAGDLEDHITADLESNRKRALIAIVSVLLGLPLLALIWVWVLQNMRRHLNERDHAELALRESEERFRAFFEQAAVGVAQIVTKTGEFLRINQKYCDIVGYSHKEMTSRTFMEITHPDDLQEDLDNMKELVAGRIREFSMEKRYFHRNGQIVWVYLTVSPMWDVGQEPDYHIAVVEDITEQKLAERALRESEERFRSLVGNIPGVVYRCELPYPWAVEHISEAVFEITGYHAEDLMEGRIQGMGTLIFPEDVENVKRLVAEGVAAHRPFELKYRIQHANGDILWVHEKGQAVYDPDGRPLWLDGVILDITERKLAEEAVESERQRFFALLEGLPAYVYLQAPDHSIRFANRYYRKQFGDPEGVPCYKSLWGRDEPCKVCPTFKVFDTGQPQIWEWDEAPDGKCYEVYDYPFTDIDGTKLVLEMGTDITERKRAEEALKLRFDLEELLTSISTEFINLEPDAIDDGIERVLESIIDTVCVDRGYIFLYSRDGDTMDNTHEHCRPGVPPHKDRLQDVPVETFAWFDAKMKRLETVAVESVASLPEEAEAEKEEWLHENIQSLVCVPMISRDRLMGFVGFDTVLYQTEWAEEIITFLKILGTVFANALDRKRAGQERERLLKTLAAKNEELQSIVYVASHDLKSPLVNIQGFSGELSRTCDQIEDLLHGEEVPAEIQKQLAPLLDEDIPESIGFIRAGTMKMQALLNGLLEVCRVGSAALEIQSLDMNKMMKHIIATMQFQITDSGAELTVDDLPCCIGDSDHVNQVFSNLLANAVKYLDPERKGEIHIWGRVEAGESIYCVQDNGLGIARQHQEKVFEIFHRLDPDRYAEGEGLGLTIALRILERHEGRIWVESEPGKGSRFFISLPTA